MSSRKQKIALEVNWGEARKLIKSWGMTVGEFAEFMGYNRGTVSNWKGQPPTPVVRYIHLRMDNDRLRVNLDKLTALFSKQEIQ